MTTAHARPWFSLRWRLMLAISGIVLLCAAVCVAGAVIFLNQALTNRAQDDLRNTLNGVSGYIGTQGSDLLGTAKLVAADPEVQAAARNGDHGGLTIHLTPLFSEVNADIMDVVDARGYVVVRMENTQRSGDYIGNHPGIRAALAGRSLIAFESDLPRVEAAGGYALRATLPLRHGSHVIGAVVVGRQLNTIFADRISAALGASVNLIAGNRRTGSTLLDSNGLPTTGVSEPPSILARIQTGKISIARVNEDGRAAFSGLVPLKNADRKWIGAVEIVQPLDSLFDVIKRLSLLLLVLGALVVVLGTFVGLAISRRLTSRLMVLESAASDVAARAATDAPVGEMQVAVSVGGKDEVASLAHSFSAMMTALDERMTANANLYAAAQARVRELSGLAQIARLLTAAPTMHETMELLGEQVCRLVGCSAVAIWLPGEGTLPALYGGHGLPPDYARFSQQALVDLAGTDFEPVAQVALRTGHVAARSLVDRPMEELPASRATVRGRLRQEGWAMATAVPLRVQDRIVGSLTCYSESETGLSQTDLSLLTTIADQVAVAVENARLYAQSRDLAALEERQRLARELHDSVSQALYGIALGAKTARTLLERDPEKVCEPLDYVLSQAEAGLTEMRALIFELRPEALEKEGLVTALEKQAEAVRARHGLTVRASLCNEPNLPVPLKEAVYRIAQEALHNTVKHARARTVDVRLHWDGDVLVMDIEDDGQGFDPHGSFPGHLGLSTMRERATWLGGTLDIESAPGGGTRICVRIPHVIPSPDTSPSTSAA